MEGLSWVYHFSRHWMLVRVPTAWHGAKGTAGLGWCWGDRAVSHNRVQRLARGHDGACAACQSGSSWNSQTTTVVRTRQAATASPTGALTPASIPARHHCSAQSHNQHHVLTRRRDTGLESVKPKPTVDTTFQSMSSSTTRRLTVKAGAPSSSTAGAAAAPAGAARWDSRVLTAMLSLQ
jgi:hypothetical protein